MYNFGVSFLDRVFGRNNKDVSKSTLSTLESLNETLENLEKREKVLIRKIADEVARAKECGRLNNKRAAIQALKKKKMYENQLEQLGNYQLRLHDQMVMVEGAKATTDTIVALKEATDLMTQMQKSTNIANVEKTLEEINEQTDNMRAVNEALSQYNQDFDEDELDQELEELEQEQIETELLKPANAPLPATSRPAQPEKVAPKQKNTVDEELAALQAEMAL